MSITLSFAETELSRQLGDYWNGVTTSAGSATSLVDTGLMAKANDWVTDDSYDQIISGTYGYATAYDGEERKISSLDNTSGTLTVLSHTGAPGITVTYRVHRLFNASEKRRALVSAAKSAFPHLHKYIWDETLDIDDADLYKEIDISTLGLAQNHPHQVWQSSDKTDDSIAWQRLRNYTVDNDGNLWLTEGSCGYDLRIIGIGYLDFLVSGVASTTWASTIAIDAPQLEILVAQAALYLCNQKIVPTDTSATSQAWAQAKNYWDAELNVRKAKFGMRAPAATVSWGV